VGAGRGEKLLGRGGGRRHESLRSVLISAWLSTQGSREGGTLLLFLFFVPVGNGPGYFREIAKHWGTFQARGAKETRGARGANKEKGCREKGKSEIQGGANRGDDGMRGRGRGRVEREQKSRPTPGTGEGGVEPGGEGGGGGGACFLDRALFFYLISGPGMVRTNNKPHPHTTNPPQQPPQTTEGEREEGGMGGGRGGK